MEQVQKWQNEISKKVQCITNNELDSDECSKVCCKISSCLYCLPCYGWSFVWRIIYCPFQCICNEPIYALSNNNCTQCSDSCIELCFKSIDMTYGRVKTAFPTKEYAHDTKVRDEVDMIVKNVFQKMKDVSDTSQQYKLCDLLSSIVRSIHNNSIDYNLYPAMTYDYFASQCNI